jgi:hypothetical protein
MPRVSSAEPPSELCRQNRDIADVEARLDLT